jgi:NhaP-type Na+/H+ and K+/H+ antiporter
MIYTKDEHIAFAAVIGGMLGFAAGIIIGGIVEALGHSGYLTILLCAVIGALGNVAVELRGRK